MVAVKAGTLAIAGSLLELANVVVVGSAPALVVTRVASVAAVEAGAGVAASEMGNAGPAELIGESIIAAPVVVLVPAAEVETV